LEFLLLSTVLPAIAQVTAQTGLWIHGVDFSIPEKSFAFVSAVSSTWRAGQEPIMGYAPLVLPADAFQVFVDSQSVGAVQSTGFQQSDAGLDLVLAIDVSGSVYPNYEFVKRGVSGYVERRRPEKDQIALITFGSTVNISEFAMGGKYTPFTDSIDPLKEFIAKPPSAAMRSRTLLFRAVAEAVNTLAHGRLDPGDRRIQKALFVLSDGHDEEVGFDIGVPIRAAKDNQIPLFCVALPETATQNKYHDNLRKMAEETGGTFLAVEDLRSLEGFFERLDYLIKNEKVLTFQFPRALADGKAHTLRIQAKHGDIVVSKSAAIVAPFLPPSQQPGKPLWIWVVLFVFLMIFTVVLWAFIRMKTLSRPRGA
jgi:hypothetical protein